MKSFVISILSLAAVLFSLVANGQTPAPPVAGSTQLFQVVLLVGSTTGAEATEGLSKSAEKAISDIRDFLPFKRYRLLDSGLLRTTAGRRSELTMEGMGGQKYRVSLSFQGDRLRPGDTLNVPHFEVGVPSVRTRALEPGEAPPAPSRGLISTSFSLAVGETIVVGSSKLGGTDALVVLLTAIPPSS